MKFFLSVYFVGFLCLVACVLTFFLIKEVVTLLSINKLRSGKERDAEHICDLLTLRYPDAAVYRNVYLLKKEAADQGLKCACDIVYISRGGVLLITVFPDTGAYDNPKAGTWRYRYINQQKETVTLQKSNPFDRMAFFASVTEKLLLSENILNASVARCVVFTADLVDYTTNYAECLTIPTLFRYIDAFNRRKHFNRAEFYRACDVISACSEYLEQKLPDSVKNTEKEPPVKPKAVRTPPPSKN